MPRLCVFVKSAWLCIYMQCILHVEFLNVFREETIEVIDLCVNRDSQSRSPLIWKASSVQITAGSAGCSGFSEKRIEKLLKKQQKTNSVDSLEKGHLLPLQTNVFLCPKTLFIHSGQYLTIYLKLGKKKDWGELSETLHLLFQGQLPPSVLAGRAQHEQGSLKRASCHKGIKHSKSFIKLKSKWENLSATQKKKYNPSFSCPCTDKWLWALCRPQQAGLCAAQRFIFWWGYFKVSGI